MKSNKKTTMSSAGGLLYVPEMRNYKPKPSFADSSADFENVILFQNRLAPWKEENENLETEGSEVDRNSNPMFESKGIKKE